MNKLGSQHVVIVGGGLIGLSATYALLREGHRVTIIERDKLGSGAATGNAGELTPQQVAPLASPHTARDVTVGVFTRSSYLSIAPLKLPQLAGFGLGFLRASSQKRSAHGAAALAQFAHGIFPALDRMTADGIDTSGGSEGYLMTCSDEGELLAAHEKYRRRARKGWGEEPEPILRGSALRAAEPTVAPGIRAGFMLPAERSLDPVTFVASLIRHVTAAGAEVHTGMTALRLGKGASIVCENASGAEVSVSGDRVIVAAGAWTTPILKRSGVRSTSIVSGKGYSYTVPVERMPQTLVHSIDRHCVVIPMHDRLRVVGMMEFDGRPDRFNADQIDVLTRAASGLITGADWQHRTDEWVGARPMTADGMPLLGAIPNRPEVLVAAGHNMHGLSLGPVTGEVLADLVAGREPAVDGKPLNLRPFVIKR
ncbi:FAD-binding oxidoreductase [Leucobacter coleopterorum]|uniref:FAD-binding oxidoreductase n=1 Tax=Leucobacter coleopterorum TaxID=2714933 RepID=A0ABX6K1F5_9MICO|nr:FAD-binding oxidoreductase [Leucobacter coleopterorum]QIM19024.1 FAD-binding oxidoreductase [Leucobacter coleopterorum]